MADVLNCVIDLSHHNGDVDLAKAAADGIVGVIHKATQGIGFKDSLYANNKQQAKDAGLLWGAYHFGDGSDPVKQADHFLDTVTPDPQTLLVLDFEPNTLQVAGPAGQTMTLAGAEAFVNRVNDRLGRFPGLYSDPSFLKEALGTKPNQVLANCWLWIAQYTLTTAPSVPKNWSSWTMWQYTDGKNGSEPRTVRGVGKCDRNRFNGELTGLQQLWGVAVDEAAASDDSDADAADSAAGGN
jgi:lysozyme